MDALPFPESKGHSNTERPCFFSPYTSPYHCKFIFQLFFYALRRNDLRLPAKTEYPDEELSADCWEN